MPKDNAYLTEVDLNVVWRTAQEDLPKLIEQIEACLATQPPPGAEPPKP
jgi:uncharacterized protein with HEPN domain